MQAPSRPRPTLAAPARPRPGVQPAPVAAPSPIPERWQSGSAVFREGYAGRVADWITPIEQQDGFLGRLHQDAEGYSAFRFVQAANTYRRVGRKATMHEAFSLL